MDERYGNAEGGEVFGPILMRSSTPPPNEKVSQFLRTLAEAPRVSKPMSNYGSEFEHISGDDPGWPDEGGPAEFLTGPPISIPPDAQQTHHLNQELFGDDSEVDYVPGPGPGPAQFTEVRQPDEVQSVEHSHSHSLPPWQTPAEYPQQIPGGSPPKSFRNGKVIDSYESWGNMGPLPGPNVWSQPRPSQVGDTPAKAAAVPLPPQGQTPGTPFINIQAATESRAVTTQTPPSVAGAKSHKSKSRKTSSHKSSVVNGGQKEVIEDVGNGTEKDQSTEKAASEASTEMPTPTVRTLNANPPAGNPSSSRPQSRAENPRSRATSRAERPTSPLAPNKVTRTPSRVPLPLSPEPPQPSFVPMLFGGSPKKAPSKAPTVPSERAASPPPQTQVPLKVTSPKIASPRLAPKSQSVRVPSPPPKSPKSPSVRLHPLTDLLRQENAPRSRPTSPLGRPPKSTRSQRTTMTDDLPPITMQLSQTPSGDIGLTQVPTPYKRKDSRAPSRQSRTERTEDEEGSELRALPARIHEITEIDLTRTPRSAFTALTTPSALAGEVNASHFHDEELCILLHAADNENTHEIVRKVLRKGVRERVRKLGLDHQRELMIARKHHQQGLHRTRAIKNTDEDETPPKWAQGLFEILRDQQKHIAALEDANRALAQAPPRQIEDDDKETIRGPEPDQAPTVDGGEEEFEDDYTENHMTVPIDTPQDDHEELYEEGDDVRTNEQTDGDTRSKVGTLTQHDFDENDEEVTEFNPHVAKPEMYRLRIKDNPDVGDLNKTWHVSQTGRTEPPFLPDLHDTGEELHHNEVQERNRPPSPPLPLPLDSAKSTQPWPPNDWQVAQAPAIPSWQRIYQRLLDWALVWSENELQRALTSTLPGTHVDEVGLTIWLTQTYKRYVRAKHVEHPPGRVDRCYVPPNIADAINIAVFNGRHGDAKAMLRDLWAPFGFEGMPRLLIVLARHRRDTNHYVVHRFALPEGSLTTYDTYPDKTLADGRPLGWWFAIQAAWPNAIYPQPDNLVQKIIRINRPMQLTVDNSVAAAAIWRNLIMGSKAERSVDLVRLRDLINTEVKSLIARKELGRLTVLGGKSQWEEIPP